MKEIRVHNNAIVIVLNKREAKALYDRTQQYTGIKGSRDLLKAISKLSFAIALSES